ncbi:hypothetical protein CAPTEDRAFT_186995 [Capitella teleta]|uniref:AMP-dependent synthetase/ligase domain-containing protein n=1 Tax=Capitella teleta TaxID=283909 RepID=R7T446_CAPTE|nr:hypothetical protein CAPTEDRAFT_186995 [Capitella teleta]|eukprot:ELT87526.1 hypothetical protein CAPTEDRAFT_186995 [Capitella teleta]
MEDFDYEHQGLPYEMFMRQAKETPDRIAVVSPGENRQLTYKELDDVTDVLATNMRINGVEEDCIVGIYMEKCLNYTISYIATLKAGATLVIVPDTVIYDPFLLCQFLKEHRISRMMFTPSLLEAVLDADRIDFRRAFHFMRVVLFCGEVLTTRLLERCLKALPSVQFFNMYGTSEANCVAIADLSEWYRQQKGEICGKKFCPVGKLLPGVKIVILNDEMQAQPVGVAGEIYIGGPKLALGYLKQPELTRARFIKKPDGVSDLIPSRLHRSGDWGYLLSDGTLEVCGRCDSKVKIRGYSIEIQAVEAALLSLPVVNACVVLVEGEEGQDKNLIAYVVPENQENMTIKRGEIRASLKKRLPFYMIPSYFVFLESLPLHAKSGKVDKKALPLIDKYEWIDMKSMSCPSTPTENSLVPFWADILSLKSVDIYESFFNLGGIESLGKTESKPFQLLAQLLDEMVNVQVSFRPM